MSRAGPRPRRARRARAACLAAGLFALLAGTAPRAAAQDATALRLAGVFGDHMVLQAGRELPVWGRATPGALVTLRLAGRTTEARAGTTGRWGALLPELAPGGPHTLEVSSRGERLVCADVLVGEVWIAAGSSNMALPLWMSAHGEARAAAAERPRIRVAHVPPRGAGRPLPDVPLRWSAVTPAVARDLSAVAWAFAERLHAELDVPVGIVQATYPFSRLAPWIPREALAAVPALASVRRRVDEQLAAHRAALAPALPAFARWLDEARAALAAGRELPRCPELPRHPLAAADPDTSIYGSPTGLFNAMIAPLAPFPARGVIWHQGEQDLGTGAFFADLQRGLVEGWREAWRRDDLAFLAVQLSPYRYGQHRPTEKPELNVVSSRLPELWEAQALLLALPHTGLAPTGDLGSVDEFFMPQKHVVGRRLADIALARTYGRADLPHAAPLFTGLAAGGAVEPDDGAPVAADAAHAVGSLVASFRHAEGLASADGGAVTWLELAGADGVFQPARARCEAGGRLRAWSPRVPAPRRLRYGWHQEARGNLVNAAGLPALPFRASLR